MTRILRILFSILLVVAVSLPPRLHAAAAGASDAMAACGHHHQHVAPTDCDNAPAGTGQAHPLEMQICIAACACLPAQVEAPAIAYHPAASCLMSLLNARIGKTPAPDGPFRPPKLFS